MKPAAAQIAQGGLSQVGDFQISFTYDELRDFVIAYMLIASADGGDIQKIERELGRIAGLPIYEGVYKYVYLLARKEKLNAAIALCERANDFVEHFSLNVQLLPPNTQDNTDVDRLKAMLSDLFNPERVRRIAVLLVHRPNLEEPINIKLLVDHMNGLADEVQMQFIQILFGQFGDFPKNAWQKRVDDLAESVLNHISKKGPIRYEPYWLAFWLHVASRANWQSKERASNVFKSHISSLNIEEALQLVNGTKCGAVNDLLLEIQAMAETT